MTKKGQTVKVKPEQKYANASAARADEEADECQNRRCEQGRCTEPEDALPIVNRLSQDVARCDGVCLFCVEVVGEGLIAAAVGRVVSLPEIPDEGGHR